MITKNSIAKGLIVDDDTNVHEILSEGLPNFTFISAHNIQEAEHMITKKTFTFALLDYRLGSKRTGLSLVSLIRKSHPLALVALMSAYGTPYVLKEALDEQVDTFFDKPIILSRFQEKLTDLLRRKGLLTVSKAADSVFNIEQLLHQSDQNIAKVSLKDCAKDTNQSYKYLSQKFKKETGITFQRAKREEKYNYIKQLLSDTNLSIKDISKQTGFANPSAIMRGFKDFTGQTMTEYRHTHKR